MFIMFVIFRMLKLISEVIVYINREFIIIGLLIFIDKKAINEQ